MLKSFKKNRKTFKVAFSDNVIHYGAVVAEFDQYADAVDFINEQEKNDSIEWVIL
jgi:hypothetical protein